MSTTLARMCIAAAICSAAFGSPSKALSAESVAPSALEERELFPFKFRFNTDDLASTAGAQRVYRDLKRQAERACTTRAASGSHILRVDRQCAAELMAAVAQRARSKTLMAQLNRYR